MNKKYEIDAENALDDVIFFADNYMEHPNYMMFCDLRAAIEYARSEIQNESAEKILALFGEPVAGNLHVVKTGAAALRKELDGESELERLTKAVDAYANRWSDENRGELESALSETGTPDKSYSEEIEDELETMSAVIFMPHSPWLDEREGLDHVVAAAAKIRELIK